ncbi:hypothetical protein BDP55DRAFT_724676 [Colletotrichum godetiae]|uniref:Uncharacterized protein n=1 Tax=Colletotrichum godetiae TaxID=1209918 RepID=A0AAJ0AYD7_9PEZI|nr:uncharacterized protein BDP55DRAFT_724676 [Colletotrichum godetiae]KAK1691130.1 hypothetical protein BDP55DRAFT_724676 [Colletotrichum godetiae]
MVKEKMDAKAAAHIRESGNDKNFLKKAEAAAKRKHPNGPAYSQSGGSGGGSSSSAVQLDGGAGSSSGGGSEE